MRFLLASCLLFCISATMPTLSEAAERLVRPSGSPGVLQQAIDTAQPGDVLLVAPGVYYERLNLRDDVDLVAQSIGTAIIDAENEGPAVTAVRVGPATLVRGLVFKNGSSEEGGGLRGIGASAVFEYCSFVENTAVSGGAIHLSQASEARFDHCSIDANSASVGGAVYLDFSEARFTDGSMTNNHASTDGAAISANNAAEAVFTRICLVANTADRGGIIACNYASPTFDHCTVTSNFTQTSRGVFVLRGSAARIEACIVSFNSGLALECPSSSPWIGCNDFFGNGDDSLCAGDQGDNLFIDPQFCDPAGNDYQLLSTSPLIGTSCGTLGAHDATCNGAATDVSSHAWGDVKKLFRTR